MKIAFKFLCIALVCCLKTQAQNGIESILFTGIEDANKLTQAYVNPAMKGFIHAMNNGWYHTAKVHKTLGLDLTVGASGAFISAADESFNFTDLQLSNLIVSHPSSSPTLAGGEVPTGDQVTLLIPANSLPDLNDGVHPELTNSFTMPDGFKSALPMNVVPAPPMAQLSIGLPFKADLILRMGPKINLDETDIHLFGVGLKKEITHWFGPVKYTPLHVSLLGTYTQMGISTQIEDSVEGTNRELAITLNSYSIQAIASLNFPIINFYGGFGYSGGNSQVDMLGNYHLTYQTGLPSPNNTVTRTLTDPIEQQFTTSTFKTTVGTRLSLGFFKVFADYSIQEYNTVSAGVAISIR